MTNGQRGEVVAVDVAAGSLAVDFGRRRLEVDRAFLTSVTRDGEPTLVRGYAMTGHVAQGATVDRAFVLASDGMSREWAYVALSRGRLSNRLYVAAQPDSDRAEFAPVTPALRDPIERLASTLRESEAQVLALDSGTVDASEERLEAERIADRTRRERQAIEGKRHQWLPSRRRELEAARDRERSATAVADEARRREAEARHAGRTFVTHDELEARRDKSLFRTGERMTERVLQRDRGFGRER